MKQAQIIVSAVLLTLTTACRIESSKKEGDAQGQLIELYDQQAQGKVDAAVAYNVALTGDSQSVHAKQIADAQARYFSCSDHGRKTVNSSSVNICAGIFGNDLNIVLKAIASDYRLSHDLSFAELEGKVLGLADTGSAIAKDLDKVKQSYFDCQDKAFAAEIGGTASRSLRACELTVEAEITRLGVAISNVDVDPLDTF